MLQLWRTVGILPRRAQQREEASALREYAVLVAKKADSTLRSE